MIDLPEPLESAPGFSLHAICHYDERGPSHYWNSLRGSEHMGTHLDAPVHWITGRDGIALSGVDSLTPSERRVAEMAAKGHTNREVAQALFVTPKTVEVHLSSVYLKLGICSRSQLATALAEPGRRP